MIINDSMGISEKSKEGFLKIKMFIMTNKTRRGLRGKLLA